MKHQHAWRDVERTIQGKPRGQLYDKWVETTQWVLQWCESCGDYRQTKIKGASQAGPAPLRSPVPETFLKE